jgi:phosphoribosylanthranilate isomerase
MERQLKIKVCGMREPENISGVVATSPDYIGFIFYPKSPRFLGLEPVAEMLSLVPDSIKKVGVFVNELPETILQVCGSWKLNVAQLHGQEPPEVCQQIKQSGLKVFKAFSVDETFDPNQLRPYAGVCDCFLFDTKGQLPGGSGKKFDWQLLENYRLDVPFFLSGGIGPDDAGRLSRFVHPSLYGLDINSGFELAPAIKDVEKVKDFIQKIRIFK